MSAKAKRCWLQIHLSTAIVLMFASGGLLAVNMRSVRGKQQFQGLYNIRLNLGTIETGWPASWARYTEPACYGRCGDITIPGRREFSTIGVAIDSVTAILCLMLVTFVLELLIRRKQQRNAVLRL